MVEEKENNKKNIIKSILAIIIYFSGSTVLLFILDFLHINLIFIVYKSQLFNT